MPDTLLKNRYLLVYETLRNRILSGDYPAGEKLPSDTRIARQFNVSRPTVAKAVTQLKEEGLVERRAGSGTHVIDTTQRDTPTRTFGLLVPSLGETEIFEPICGQIANLSQEHRFNLLWDGTTSLLDDEGRLVMDTVERYIEKGVDGIFFTPLELVAGSEDINNRILERLKQANIAVILLDRDVASFPVRSEYDLIGVDNLEAGLSLTNHLLNQGCRDIAFVTRPELAATVPMRLLGARMAVDATSAGPYSGNMQQHQDAATTPDNAKGQAVIRTIELSGDLADDVARLQRSGLPDALICYNDAIAAELMLHLLESGVRIPDNMLMAGFDDVKYAKLLRVPLTTIHQPCRAIGAAAVAAMIERLEQPQLPARHITFKGELIIRKSTQARTER